MTINRERMKRKEQGGSLDNFSSPEELIAQIQEWQKYYKENHDSEIIFEYDSPPYSDSQYLYVNYWRDETDAEMARRIEMEEKNEAWQRQREAAEFARLKAKFEGNS